MRLVLNLKPLLNIPNVWSQLYPKKQVSEKPGISSNSSKIDKKLIANTHGNIHFSGLNIFHSNIEIIVFLEMESAKLKRKKSKFTVIGDGYIYYMLSDMQGWQAFWAPFSELSNNIMFLFQNFLNKVLDGTTLRTMLCNHEQTIAEAFMMLHEKKEWLQKKKKKVLISIGASDLRTNKGLGEMKRDFVNLFLLCDKYDLKPLITTVLCFDSPMLKRKADMFNQFLVESFENVIDLHLVGLYGLTEVMSTLNQG